MMKTYVYIDGFNLYNRAVKNTPYKWLDLYKLCEALLPSHQIQLIRYFTSLVNSRPDNPQAPLRQQIYIRALKTLANVQVMEYGQFRTRRKERPLVTKSGGFGNNVLIWDTEEKGTDVNLASYLIMDGCQNNYEQALVISNDADLALSISMVRNQLRFPVGVVNPNLDPKQGMPKALQDVASFQKRIYKSTLAKCQLPNTITDHKGTITKPASW